MDVRYPGAAEKVARYLADCAVHPVDIPVLQPADPFLDMAGEDLRSRIFLTESETGDSLCLRPEFTIPVCRDHIAANATTPRRYGYLGEVFRQRREGGTGFLQAGIEDLGDPDLAESDARSIADAHGLLRAVLPEADLRVTVGDQAVFDAVLEALGLPRGWQRKLARTFGRPDLLQAAMEELGRTGNRPDGDGRAAELATAGDLAALTDFVAAEMASTGFSGTSGRTPSEIAARMIEKQALASVAPSPDTLDALQRFLAIRVPLSDAMATLRDFAGTASIDIGPGLGRFQQRVDRLAERGTLLDDCLYDGGFGRALDYYTGLVFEIGVPASDRPLVGGGRYDRLLTMLGSAMPIPGVGFSVWIDRLDALAGPT